MQSDLKRYKNAEMIQNISIEMENSQNSYKILTIKKWDLTTGMHRGTNNHKVTQSNGKMHKGSKTRRGKTAETLPRDVRNK